MLHNFEKDMTDRLLSQVDNSIDLDLIDKLTDQEVDLTGRWVGFDLSNYVWNKYRQYITQGLKQPKC